MTLESGMNFKVACPKCGFFGNVIEDVKFKPLPHGSQVCVILLRCTGHSNEPHLWRIQLDIGDTRLSNYGKLSVHDRRE